MQNFMATLTTPEAGSLAGLGLMGWLASDGDSDDNK